MTPFDERELRLLSKCLNYAAGSAEAVALKQRIDGMLQASQAPSPSLSTLKGVATKAPGPKSGYA